MGNWVADEVLYQARSRPERKGGMACWMQLLSAACTVWLLQVITALASFQA